MVDRDERAHPRSRGENVIGQLLSAVGEGSSPLTRGKLGDSLAPINTEWLIPAHAGKTYGSHTLTVPSWAHPRSRGENIQTTVQTVAGWGSSPLTRGKHRGLRAVLQRDRLIPAHAGKTRRLG